MLSAYFRNVVAFYDQVLKVYEQRSINGFKIIFILAILEFILTTVKQIKRKNDEVRIF